MTNQRWTFNTNANALGDEAKYKRTLDAWKPPGQLLMNGLKGTSEQNTVVRMANHLRALGGNTIYRPYESGNAEKRFWKNRTVDEHIRFIRDHQAPPWIWFQIGNEPTFDNEHDARDMSKWLAEQIRKCALTGERLVVYNPAVGSFQRWQIEAGWFDDLLIALSENAHRIVDGWPQFILGSHSAAYWMGIAAVHCAGRNPADLIHPERLTKDKWPTAEQIFDADTGDNWIVMRDYWFVERAHQLRPNAPDIKIVATEAGPEDLPNIRTQFPDVVKKIDEMCGRQWRGARTSPGYYKWVYPHQSPAESLCNDFDFIDRIAPDNYLMFCWYTWSWHDAAPDYWRRDYNAGEMDDVLALYPTRAATPPPPSEQPTVITILPTDTRFTTLEFTLKSTGAASFLRDQPTIGANIIVKFVAEKARYIPLDRLAESEKRSDKIELELDKLAYWLPVLWQGRVAWVRQDAVEILSIQPEPPELPDDTPTAPSEEELLLVELRRAYTAIGTAYNNLAIASARYAEYLKKRETEIRESRLKAA